MIRAVICFGLWSLVNLAQAETWLHVAGTSTHSRSGYNEQNLGLGLEWQAEPRWSAAIGFYRNSEYRTTAYALGKYQWWKKDQLAINLNVGAATGYSMAPLVPVVLPEVCWHWTCFMIMPAFTASGTSAAAAYLRIPF